MKNTGFGKQVRRVIAMEDGTFKLRITRLVGDKEYFCSATVHPTREKAEAAKR